MLEKFLSYIVDELSVDFQEKILLAVSGGIDSMVMLSLFEETVIPFEVAHVNHSTRNGASDLDATFVKEYCIRRDIVFHSAVLNYEELAHGNFQQNARNERYRFFREIMVSNDISLLATAHHMDDRWETFVGHLDRKSGLQGLTSLKSKSHNLIRPLLCFRKKEIEDYANLNNIEYVSDVTNDLDDYTRNKIRHHISPIIERIFPDFIENVNQSIKHLESSDDLIEELVSRSGIITKDIKDGFTYIDIGALKQYENHRSLIYRILHPFGYNKASIDDILAVQNNGAMFYSDEYELLYDRGRYIVRKQTEKVPEYISIDKIGIFTLNDGRKLLFAPKEHIEVQGYDMHFYTQLNIDNHIIVRTIRPGDKYYPDHMKGKSKNIKKHLNDLKLSRFHKEKVLVVEKDGKIVQLLGL